MGMNNNELYYKLAISSIQEISFYYNINYDYSNFDIKDIQIGITYSLNVDNEKDIVGIVFGIKYSTKEDDMKLLEYSMLVSFKIPELENIISKEGENIHVKDKSIILNLLNISIGTVRGALFLKSKGTIFERFPMPLIPEHFLRQIIKSMSKD